MRSTQYSMPVLLPTWQYPLAAANIHGISEHQHNVTIYNQLYLLDGWCWCWWGPNAKWSGAGGRGLTLYTVWSLVTGWIEVMNFKTCLYACLQINLFLYLQLLVFLPCTTSSPSWEVSLRIVSKVHWKVLRSFSFRRILNRITRRTLYSSENWDIVNTETKFTAHSAFSNELLSVCTSFCGICNLCFHSEVHLGAIK